MKKLIIFVTTACIVFLGADRGLSENQYNKNIKQEKTISLPFLKEKDEKVERLISNTNDMSEVLNYLKQRENKTPYVFSGSNPKRGWDCSGLVVWTYKQFNIKISHSAHKQYRYGKETKHPKPGDIVLFGNNNHYDHSAIYLGNNKVINANRYYGTTVIESVKDFKMYSKVIFIRVIDTL